MLRSKLAVRALRKNGKLTMAKKVRVIAAEMYRDLNDAEAIDPGLGKGTTEIWYMKPEFFGDFIYGPRFLAERRPELVPTPDTVGKTHILLGKIKAKDKEDIFRLMQGEMWSPMGEARDLIRRKKLKHTSMSVGDIIKIGDTIFMVDRTGFKKIEGTVVARAKKTGIERKIDAAIKSIGRGKVPYGQWRNVRTILSVLAGNGLDNSMKIFVRKVKTGNLKGFILDEKARIKSVTSSNGNVGKRAFRRALKELTAAFAKRPKTAKR